MLVVSSRGLVVMSLPCQYLPRESAPQGTRRDLCFDTAPEGRSTTRHVMHLHTLQLSP